MTDKTPWEMLKSSLDFVEKMVGHHWMEDWVHIMRNNFGRVGQDIPPLAFRWLKAKDELAAAEFTGQLSFSPSTLHTIQLGKYMEILDNAIGFTNQLPLLKNTASFYTSCFRLAVAAAYKQRGNRLALLFGQHTPDIELHTTHGTIAIITQTVTANSFGELLATLPNELENALTKLPAMGIVYLELPLPAEHFSSLVPKIKDTCRNFSIPNHTAVVLASATTVNHAPWGVDYVFLPLFNDETYTDSLLL